MDFSAVQSAPLTPSTFAERTHDGLGNYFTLFYSRIPDRIATERTQERFRTRKRRRRLRRFQAHSLARRACVFVSFFGGEGGDRLKPRKPLLRASTARRRIRQLLELHNPALRLSVRQKSAS